MERTDILSPGSADGGDAVLTVGSWTAAAVRRRFGEWTPGPPRGSGAIRGDHELNPGMHPAMELREAAVLVPLVDRPGGLTVLLTQRTENLSNHAGQIAFPGGRKDIDDPDAVSTALRETEEEIGLARDLVEPVGRLDRYVTRTAFTITPVVAIVHLPFTLRLGAREVADAFEVPLDFFLDPANREQRSAEFLGVMRHFYVFAYRGRNIWGATAGMLVNLAEVLA